MADAMDRGEPMHPRSANDKEYFAQDWFKTQLSKLKGITAEEQGRNSYPDYWVSSAKVREGYEIKSLAFTKGRPARKDLDFNSTVPSGSRDRSRVFLVFFLYTGRGADPRAVQTLVVCHGDLINADSEFAEQHENVSVHGLGSYGDGFIRDRKMYVLPHPIAIYPQALGTARLIVPSQWAIKDPQIEKLDTITRSIVDTRLLKYTASLWKEPLKIETEASPRAGEAVEFDVFALKGAKKGH